MTDSKELAIITGYEPPYYDDRAWNPDRIDQRERRMFRALATGDPAKVEKALAALERRYVAMREPYGKTRAFALDYQMAAPAWAEHLEGLLA